MVNKEQLDDELIQKLAFVEKLGLIKALSTDIVTKPASKYRKLKDLLLLCSDKNVDVVLKSMISLCDVFCEILPDYRIREFDASQGDQENRIKDKKDKADKKEAEAANEGKEETKKKEPHQKKLAKDTIDLRNQE